MTDAQDFSLAVLYITKYRQNGLCYFYKSFWPLPAQLSGQYFWGVCGLVRTIIYSNFTHVAAYILVFLDLC
jgi:hypothetical protein